MSYMESFARRALAAVLAFVMVFSLALVPLAATVAVAETIMDAGTTDPADDPTDPADDPTDPADDPTDPADDPTDPADDPTDPADDPTDPADDPTNPADDPTDPADDPTDPADDPTNPADDPTDPADDPIDPADDPIDPADDPTDPEPAVIEITVKAEDNSKKYGDDDPDLTATVIGEVAEGDKIEYTVSREEGETVGSYTITVSGDETQCEGKYHVTYQTGTFTITTAKLSIVITGNTSTDKYDGMEKSVTGYTASCDSNLYDESKIEYVGASEIKGTDAGEYSMGLTKEQFSYDGGENVEATFIITDGKLSIAKREVTLTSESGEKPYDNTPLTKPDVTVDGDGFVDGEVSDIKATGSVTTVEEGEVTNTIVFTEGENFNADNYVITKNEGILKITASTAKLSIESANGEWTYDGIAHTKHEYTVTYGAEESITVVIAEGETTGTATLPTGDTVTITPATDASITHVAQGNVENTFTWTVTSESNYTKGTDTYGTLSISPAMLTITTGSDSRAYNGQPLTAEGSISGFVNNETADFTVTGTITNVGEETNSYTLLFAGEEGASETATAVRSDYTLSESIGTLTVTQADPKFAFNTTHENQYTVEGVWNDQVYDFGASATSTVFAEGEHEQYSITYSVNVEEDYAVIDNAGKLTVKQPCELTVTASFAYNGEDGGANFTNAELTFGIQVFGKPADDNGDVSAGDYIYFDPADPKNQNYICEYILGTNNGIVSTAQVKMVNWFDLRQATYSLKDHKDALNINASNGKVQVTDYASLADEMQKSDTKSISVRVYAHLDQFLMISGETKSYTIVISFADWPETIPYQISEATGNPVTDIDAETEETEIVPNWYTAYPVVSSSNEEYTIAFKGDFSFKTEITISTDGAAIRPEVHLKASDGGITEARELNKALFVDTVAPDELSFTTEEMIKDTILDTVSLGFYQGSINIVFTASDETSGVDYVEWKYTKSEGVSDKNADSTEWKRCDFNDAGELVDGIEGNAHGTISFKVYDKAGNCTEWNDGNPSGVFVLDSIAPVFEDTVYSGKEGTDKHFEENVLYFNISELDGTENDSNIRDNNTVTAVITINEANFYEEDVAVSLTKDGGESYSVTPVWTEGTEADDRIGTFKISGDGTYSVCVAYKDRSQNEMITYQSGEIVIDATSPKLEIAYSDPATTEEENGATTRYYGSKQDGKATITLTVEERYFSESGVDVNLDGSRPTIQWTHEGYTHTGTFVIDGDGDHSFTVTVTDQAGNQVSDKSCKIIIDTVKPTISVSYSPNDIVNSIGGVDYYKTTQIATVTFTEDHFDGGKVTITDGTVLSTSWDKKKNEGNQYAAEVEFAGDKQYGFSVSVTDKAGNEADTYSHQLTVDKTPPTNVRVEVLGKSVSNIIDHVVFFREYVTVRVSASDALSGVHSFQFSYVKDPEASDVNLDQLNKAVMEGSFTNEGNEASVTFTLPKEASETLEKEQMNGTLRAVATDRSGNSGYGSYDNKFIYDTEKPIMEVSFSDPSNDKAEDTLYYKENAVGTIRISEANFYQEHVEVSATRNGEPVDIEIEWKKTGKDENTGTFILSDEGDYGVTVTYSDGSGNEAGTYESKQIVVDKTANPPTIVINGAEITEENGGVYAGSNVTIEYEMDDLNLDQDAVTLDVLLTPSFREQEDVTEKRAYFHPEFTTDETDHKTTCTGSFDIKDIIDDEGNIEVDVDGIYDLLITLNDLAGNTATKHVQLAVCRHGSVYQYDGDFAAKIGQYLKKQEGQDAAITEDLVIYEYCPTNLATEESTIAIKINRNIDEEVASEKDIKREVVQEDPSKGWYQYRYVIDKKYFTQDGEYSILISSEYEAIDDGNTSVKHISSIGDENAFYKNGSPIKESAWFVVDTSSPDISSIVNMDKSSVNADTLTVNFTVEEAYGIESAEVQIDGDVMEPRLEQVGSTYRYEFDIPSGMDKTVIIRVKDKAGNVTDTSANNFKDMINGRYEFKDTITVSTNPFVRWYANKPLFWGTIGGAVALAGGAGAAVVVRRRKKGII